MTLKSASPDALQILEEIGLGALPTGWKIVRMEELFAHERGISVGVMYPGTRDPFGIPLIRAADVAGNFVNPRPGFQISLDKHNEYRRTELLGGELLISLVGDIGRCAVVPPNMAGWNVARAIAVLRFLNPADAAFVRLCLLSSPLQHLMQAWATTTVQVTLNLKEIRQLPLPWPPQEQRKMIVEMVGALDEKIRVNSAMNETLEAMARAIFRSWFVDFDPVRANAEGRQPLGVDAETAALFPSAFEASSLGKIPLGWDTATLGDLVFLEVERVDAASAKDNLLYVALDDMPSKSIDLSMWRSGAEVNSSIIRFKRGDILFGSMRPYFHKVGLAQFDGITRTTTFVLRPKEPAFRHFALIQFSSDEVVEYSTTASVGTTIPYIKWEALAKYPIIIPPQPILNRFEQVASPLTRLMASHGSESHTLTSIRDALVPKLISGEIRAIEAEKMVVRKT